MQRKTGDTVEIAGDYQFQAIHFGNPVQRAWHRGKLIMLARLLEAGPADRVLDLGCGSGVCAAFLAEHAGHVTGVDGNARAIAFARSQFRSTNLEFLEGQLDELDLPAGSFTKAVCLEVVEHLYEPQVTELLRHTARALAPGGRLLISTPNYHSLWPIIETSLDLLRLTPRLDGDQHVSKFYPAKLQHVVEGCGFGLLASRSVCTAGPWIAPISSRLADRATHFELGHALPFGTILVQVFAKS